MWVLCVMHSTWDAPPSFRLTLKSRPICTRLLPPLLGRVPMYCSSHAPVANTHIWPNPSRPIVGGELRSLPTMELRNCILLLNGATRLLRRPEAREKQELSPIPLLFSTRWCTCNLNLPSWDVCLGNYSRFGFTILNSFISKTVKTNLYLFFGSEASTCSDKGLLSVT